MDCEDKDTNRIQDEARNNLAATEDGVDEILNLELDGYLDNILRTSEDKSEQNASIKTQK
jgi:hypothetical protein